MFPLISLWAREESEAFGPQRISWFAQTYPQSTALAVVDQQYHSIADSNKLLCVRLCRTNKCEYRKCEAACEESSWDFEFEGEPYERNRFCCDFNFCNGDL